MNWWESGGEVEHTAEDSEMILSSRATSWHLGGPFQGNGNPLQYSCLESPMDGGAW